jgi:hypothetical protein
MTTLILSANASGHVPDDFGGFTIDVSSLVGNLWNSSATFPFADGRMRNLTRGLTPAVLRIGGTEGDEVYYNVAPDSQRFSSYGDPLNASRLVALFGFAKDLGLNMVFGLNGGKGPRQQQQGVAVAEGAVDWHADNALELIRWATTNFPGVVSTWELGNEPNLFPANGAPLVGGRQLARDFSSLRALLRNESAFGGYRLSGVDSAYQIVDAEVLLPVTREFVHAGGAASVDAINYHYYPLLGKHVPVPIVTHNPKLDPWFATQARAVSASTFARSAKVMSGVVALATSAGKSADGSSPPAVWLGETALACFGGEEGVSDSWSGTFYYLETLGQAARQGVSLVARQDLSGAGYGLIDRATLTPRPDFWALALWKRFMGGTVLQTTLLVPPPPTAPALSRTRGAPSPVEGEEDGARPAGLRAYAHCAPESPPASRATVLLLNVAAESTRVDLVSLALPQTRAYVVSAGGNASSPLEDTSGVVLLDGRRLSPDVHGALPFAGSALKGYGAPLANSSITLEPFTYAFISPVLANACNPDARA